MLKSAPKLLFEEFVCKLSLCCVFYEVYLPLQSVSVYYIAVFSLFLEVLCTILQSDPFDLKLLIKSLLKTPDYSFLEMHVF